MPSSLKKYFIAPHSPRNAAAFVDDTFVVVELGRARRGFELVASALTRLPAGLVIPGFDSQNVQDIDELSAAILQTAEAAGLSNKRRWSVALPEAAARTMVVTLESKPATRREVDEIIGWKIERLVATPTPELRITRQRISPAAGQERYVVTVAREDVLSEYGAAFERAGWKAGLVLPRHLAEAHWLMIDSEHGDRMLVSSNRSGFTSVIIRNGEPALIRSFVCDREATADELHRFALFYRDRLGDSTGGSPRLNGVLVLGAGVDVSDALNAVGDALDQQPRAIEPSELGFNLDAEGVSFDQLAAAAGVASMSWQ
jgi:hypothetical protein